jgi:hypothetical protein
MSIFREETIACPACGTEVEFDLVQSVSADRRPDLRDAILDGSFQRKACPSCGKGFRVEPEFVYMDFGRSQYIGAWPTTRRHEWQACAAQTRATFDDAMGKNAPASARKLGDKLQCVRCSAGPPWSRKCSRASSASTTARFVGDGSSSAVMRQRGGRAGCRAPRSFALVGAQDNDPLHRMGRARRRRRQRRPWLRVPRPALRRHRGAEPETWGQGAREQVRRGRRPSTFQRELLTAADRGGAALLLNQLRTPADIRAKPCIAAPGRQA